MKTVHLATSHIGINKIKPKVRSRRSTPFSKSQEDTKQAMLNVMEDLEAAKGLIELEKVKDEAIFASIGEGLIAVDNNHKITNVNKAVESMLGTTRNKLIGTLLSDLHFEEEDGTPVAIEKRPSFLALSSGESASATYFFVKKDKIRFPLAMNATPIIVDGKTIGLIETLRDVTREKAIDRAKTEFVFLASHQLRTPLGIAKWYLEAIKTEGYLSKVPEIAKDYFNEIYKSNERLLMLVRDLLTVSRIDQGRVSNAPQLVNIADLIKEILKNLKILAAKNKVTLVFDEKKTNLPSVLIDLLRVQEVIENLLTNAITYSHPSEKVTTMLDGNSHELIVKVTDTGIGISKEDKPKLFTKFFRSENAIAKNTEGSGLGLYVVKSYVNQWGGTISVESTEHKGSTFSITMPLKANSIQKEADKISDTKLKKELAI